MRGFGSIGLGYLGDGTPVAVNTKTGEVLGPASPALISASGSAQSNAQEMSIPQAVPSQAGGGNVQGRGLVFQYQTPNIASLAPGATTTVTIQFDQNSVFNWLRTTFTVDLTNAAETVGTLVTPFVTLLITDTGNGMSFMNSSIPLYTIAGFKGELPYVLPTPQLIQSNASYQYQFASYSTAGGGNQTYNNLRVQFHGYRIFNTGQQGTG